MVDMGITEEISDVVAVAAVAVVVVVAAVVLVVAAVVVAAVTAAVAASVAALKVVLVVVLSTATSTLAIFATPINSIATHAMMDAEDGLSGSIHLSISRPSKISARVCSSPLHKVNAVFADLAAILQQVDGIVRVEAVVVAVALVVAVAAAVAVVIATIKADTSHTAMADTIRTITMVTAMVPRLIQTKAIAVMPTTRNCYSLHASRLSRRK